MDYNFFNDSSWYKPIDELTFADDFMFGKVMESKEICKQIIEFLLGIKVEKLEFPRLQEVLNPCYNSKSIRLDVYTSDDKRIFDIEIQIARKEDLPLRMRYYQGIMDTDFLLKGNDYADMKSTYIVFICMFDPIGKNLPVYTIEQKISENDEIYNDKSHKVLYNVNAFESSDNENVKAFLRYIKTRKASDNFTRMLEKRIADIKQIENYRKDYMTYQLRMMDCAREARKEGMAQGAHEARVETARAFLSLGVATQEQIATATGLPLAEIQKLANSQNEIQK